MILAKGRLQAAETDCRPARHRIALVELCPRQLQTFISQNLEQGPLQMASFKRMQAPRAALGRADPRKKGTVSTQLTSAIGPARLHAALVVFEEIIGMHICGVTMRASAGKI